MSCICLVSDQTTSNGRHLTKTSVEREMKLTTLVWRIKVYHSLVNKGCRLINRDSEFHEGRDTYCEDSV